LEQKNEAMEATVKKLEEENGALHEKIRQLSLDLN
jgi:hypothetical protein